MLCWLLVWSTCTIVIKLSVNLDITVSLIMTNLLPYIQKIKPLENRLKQLQILLKK
ncbi:hypothetical protein Goari_000069 [Gossypium aridum]|uniref:Uncharacterized protein n=1 Tax=Gossypium aridum TaxID=34290 RepID=A0A7J8YU09_GOSAI|nr:hypothetical protein [Gossypium aridum]